MPHRPSSRLIGVMLAACALCGAHARAGELGAEVVRVTEVEGGGVTDRVVALELDADHALALDALTVEGGVRFQHDLHAIDTAKTEHERSGRLTLAWPHALGRVAGRFERLRERNPHDPAGDQDEQALRFWLDAASAPWEAALDFAHVRERFPNDPDDDEDELEAELEVAWASGGPGWKGALSQALFWERFRASAEDDERRLRWQGRFDRTLGRAELRFDGTLQLRAFPRAGEDDRIRRDLRFSGALGPSAGVAFEWDLRHRRDRFPNDPDDELTRRWLALGAAWERNGAEVELRYELRARRLPRKPNNDRDQRFVALAAAWAHADIALELAHKRQRRRFPHDPGDRRDRDQTTWKLGGAWDTAGATIALEAELRRQRFANDPEDDQDRWTLSAEAEVPWRDALTWVLFAELERTRFPNDPAAGETETAFGTEFDLTF